MDELGNQCLSGSLIAAAIALQPVRGHRRQHGLHMFRQYGALVGQHGVYCQSQRWPGKPMMDIQIIMKSLTDAKELIQSVMEELKPKTPE